MGVGTRYSYSRLDTYKGCPFKFKLHYLDKNYAKTDSVATTFGTAVHAAEEAIAHCYMEHRPIDYITIKNQFILDCFKVAHTFKNDFGTVDTKCGKTYYDKMYEYLEKNIYRQEKFMTAHPNYEVVGAEVSYDVEINGESFVAKIDRLLRDATTGEFLIQDIKTWTDMENREITTPLQFVVYDLAVQKQFGCTEDQIKCQYDLPLLDAYYDAGTKGFIKRGLTKIQGLLDGIHSGDFKPNPNALCNYCGYCMTTPEAPIEHKFKCPYFCHWNRFTRNKSDFYKFENEWQGMENHEAIMEAFRKKYNI